MRRNFFAIAILLFLALPFAASAQLLDNSANMKILKARAQLLHYNKDRFEDTVNQKNQLNNLGGRVDCGSVDIGNQVVSSGIGQDISVIITGDIINTDNRCVNTDK